MAYTTIDKPTDYFNTKLYTGSSSAQSITGVGFQPDWVWIKNRTNTNWHNLFDSVRGNTKVLYSNDPLAEGTETQLITSFDSDGFSVGTNTDVNSNTIPAVSWNWLAGGSASSNSDGSITSTVSANTTAGFSIVSYTGTGSNATVGHGLGSVVKMFFVKELSNANSWEVYHASQGAGKNAQLNTTAPFESAGSSRWNSTAPTSTTISIGTDSGVNRSSSNYIAYCFAEKTGYSKFGSYVGNGNADGTFVYTGFKPAWVMMKRTDTTNDWFIYDNTRNPFNETNLRISANSNGAESTQTTNQIDILSNGFKCRGNAGATNTSGGTYIYITFAESPFVTSTGIPSCAR